MEIIIKKDNIRNLGEQLIEYSEELSTDINKFNLIIENINTAWSGDDSLKYINIMKEKYSIGLEELQELIKEYGTYLKNIPEAYSILEEIFSSKKIDV